MTAGDASGGTRLTDAISTHRSVIALLSADQASPSVASEPLSLEAPPVATA